MASAGTPTPNFPGSLDTTTTFNSTDNRATIILSAWLTKFWAAIVALETKIGITGSAVTSTHDYKLSGVGAGDKAASKTGVETLSNKTLTSATITSPSITTPTGIVASDVGLGNVTNTSDANKPVSTAQQTALNLKADLASPALTGVPTAPTAAVDTSTTQLATTAWVINQGYQKTAGATTAVVTGTISAGDKVILNSDGTISTISGRLSVDGTGQTASADGTIGSTAIHYDATTGNVVMAYQRNAGTSGEGFAVVGSISAQTLTFGTAVQFNGGFTNSVSIVGIGTNKVLIAFCDFGSSQQGGIIVGTTSGTAISFGTKVAFNTGLATNNISMAWDSTNSKAMLVFRSTATTFMSGSVVTVAGTVPTVNASVAFTAFDSQNNQVVWTNVSNVFVIAVRDVTNSLGKAMVCTVSGTTSSVGTIATFQASAVSELSMCYDTNSARVVIAYVITSTTFGTGIVGTVSGTTISFGTAVTFCSTATTSVGCAFDSTNFKVMITYNDGTNAKKITGTVATTAISFNTSITWNSGVTTMSASGEALVYTASSKFVVMWVSGNPKGTVLGSFYSNLSATNFLGISTAAYTNGQTATITVLGGTSTNQSGLTAGTKYYVNDDGTLGVTATQPFVGLALTATRLLVKG